MGALETDAISGLRDFWQRLQARPDALMLELGAGGELLVARLRAVLSLVLLLLPLINLLSGGKYSETMIGLFGVVLAIVMSQMWLALARHRQRYRWLPWATATYDVSLTTLILAILALDSPVTGLNSMVAWVFYLIAICMTALRNDGRLTIAIGLLAMLQYGALAVAVFALADAPEQLMSLDYGTATVANAVQRVVLIAMMTAITSTIVYRMQRLIELSGRDGLTGLPNRAWLLQRLPRMFESSRRGGCSLALALIDLDHFKRVNDDIGHLAANRALRQVAALMSDALGPGERLVRIGGQEFVALLHCPIGSAWERADRLRRALADQVFLGERGTPGPRLSFTAGLATWPQDGNNLSLLLRSADRRLQVGKRDGRNRVVARDV